MSFTEKIKKGPSGFPGLFKASYKTQTTTPAITEESSKPTTIDFFGEEFQKNLSSLGMNIPGAQLAEGLGMGLVANSAEEEDDIQQQQMMELEGKLLTSMQEAREQKDDKRFNHLKGVAEDVGMRGLDTSLDAIVKNAPSNKQIIASSAELGLTAALGFKPTLQFGKAGMTSSATIRGLEAARRARKLQQLTGASKLRKVAETTGLPLLRESIIGTGYGASIKAARDKDATTEDIVRSAEAGLLFGGGTFGLLAGGGRLTKFLAPKISKKGRQTVLKAEQFVEQQKEKIKKVTGQTEIDKTLSAINDKSSGIKYFAADALIKTSQAGRQFKNKFIDRLNPLKRIEDLTIDMKNKPLKESEKVYRDARLLQSVSDFEAERIVAEFSDNLRPYNDILPKTKSYLLTLDAIDRNKLGLKNIFNMSETQLKGKLKNIVAEIGPEDMKRVGEARQVVKDLSMKELDDYVSAGLISSGEREAMLNAHPNYIPHSRIMDQTKDRAFAMSNSFNISKTDLERAVGSTDKIDDPLVALSERQVFKQRMVNKNKLLNNLVKTQEESQGILGIGQKQSIQEVRKFDTAEEFMKDNLLIRVEERGNKIDFDKPQGLYVSHGDKHSSVDSFTKYGKGEGVTKSFVIDKSKNPNIIELQDLGLIQTPRGLSGASAGVTYLKKILPANKFDELISLGKVSKRELIKDFSKEYPNVEWNKYFDANEVLEGYAGIKARENGIDILRLVDKTNSSFSESIILNKNAVKETTKSQLTDIWEKAKAEGKSFEEFVEAQGTPVYRGGESFSNSAVTDLGISVSRDKGVADFFSKTKKGGRVEDLVIGSDAKTLSFEDTPVDIKNKFTKISSDIPISEQLKEGPKLMKEAELSLVNYAKKQGYDVVDMSGFDRFGKLAIDAESELRIVNPNVIKTKSQLTDIFERAKGATYEGGIIPGMKAISSGVKPEKGFDTISLFRNGKKERWQVPVDVAEAIKNTDAPASGKLLKIASTPAELLRKGATKFNLSFAIPNKFRDKQTAALTSEAFIDDLAGRYGLTGAKANKLSNKELRRLYEESGGLTSSVFSEGDDALVGRLQNRGIITKAYNKAEKNTFGYLEEFNNQFERSSRIESFKQALSGGLNPKDAALVARDATIDFAKMGSWMRPLNQIVPFLNARVQGFVNIPRAIMNNPETFARMQVYTSVYPTLGLHAHNRRFKSYGNISNDIKNKYWTIMTGETETRDAYDGKPTTVPHFITIPKGEGQTLTSSPLQWWLEKEDGRDFRKVTEMLTDTLGAATPLSFQTFNQANIGSSLAAQSGPLVSIPVGLIANKHPYFGTPIIPDSRKDLKKELQFRRTTPEVTKSLANTTRIFAPAQLEFILNSFGGLPKDLQDSADLAVGLIKNEDLSEELRDESLSGTNFGIVSEFPISRRFAREASEFYSPAMEKEKERLENIQEKIWSNEQVFKDRAKEIFRKVNKTDSKEEALEYLNSLGPEMDDKMKIEIYRLKTEARSIDALTDETRTDIRALYIRSKLYEMKKNGIKREGLLQYLQKLEDEKILTDKTKRYLNAINYIYNKGFFVNE